MTEAKNREISGANQPDATAAAPEQMHLPANPPFAPELRDKAAEATARAAERAVEKRAAQEEANTFPYGVTVGQVYDGPLDLLLDLIRKQDIDIYDIPIAKITGQFLAYIENLKQSDIDGAGEFIYMASLLIHIKSKMLLPRKDDGTTDAEEDPRRELVERLLEHQRFKNAAQMLLQKQMLEESSWTNPAIREFLDDEGTEPEIAADTVDLVRIFREILERARQRPILNVDEETVTVAQMIDYVRRRLVMVDRPVGLRRLLQHVQSERALICTFLALLELVRLQAILLRQTGSFGEIYIKKHDNFESTMVEGRDDWR
ncbi:MAG: segregation/condensation protein A [Acidobacteriota bacterium]